MRRSAFACLAAFAVSVASAQAPTPPLPPVPAVPQIPPTPPVPPVPPTPPGPPPLPSTPPAVPVPLGGTSDLDALFAGLPNVVVHYDAKTETGGVTTLDNLTISAKRPDGAADLTTQLAIAHATATGLDTDAIRSVFDAARYTAAPDQSFRTLASHLELSGVTLTVGGKPTLTVANWTFENWQMKQFWFVPGGPDFAKQFTSDGEAAAKIVGNILDSVKVGAIAMTGVHATLDATFFTKLMVPAGVALPPGTGGLTTYDYQEIKQDGLDRGVFGKASFTGSTAVSENPAMPGMPAINMSIASGYVDGADVSKVLPSMMKAEWPAIAPEGLLHYGAACFENYELKFGAYGGLVVPHFCSDPIEFTWLIPKHVNFLMAGTATINPPADAQLPASLMRYAGRPLAVELHLEATYDPDAGTAALDHYAFKIAEFGGFDLRAKFNGLQLTQLAALPQTYMTGVGLTAAEAEVNDQGGLNAIFDAAMGRAGGGMTADQLKAQAASGVDMMTGMLGNTPQIAAMGKAIKDFLTGGGTLTLYAHPAAAVTIQQTEDPANQQPAAIAKLFGIGGTRTTP